MLISTDFDGAVTARSESRRSLGEGGHDVAVYIENSGSLILNISAEGAACLAWGKVCNAVTP